MKHYSKHVGFKLGMNTNFIVQMSLACREELTTKLLKSWGRDIM